MYVVILAGGKGKRFWPYSRSGKPKQFLDITGAGSMLSVTYNRLRSLVGPDKMLLLTVRDQFELVKKELPEIPLDNIFAEPVGRNTAPSIAVAAAMIRSRGSDEPFLCCPADHVVQDTQEFNRVVRSAAEVAREREVLVTFGITPGYPATGYGYIEAGAKVEFPSSAGGKRKAAGEAGFLFAVERFCEKPDREKAAAYIRRGGFYWNSGIFMWRPSVFLEAWSKFLPAGQGPLESIEKSFMVPGPTQVIDREYANMPAISVDYGILEKAGNVVVIPVNLGWNDVGSWDALGDILAPDAAGNISAGKVEAIESSGNIIFNPRGTTAVVGIDNLIVVVDGEVVMICKRGDSQRVKELLDAMEAGGDKSLL
ncbi:MAG: mannose-1-phosphate guanylyltransferase [Candidatus Krumholzibacteriota bacterium]|nr:mannose-1-phosphate guanylyltransferase [Candidatus Krumholzibacteriota bacterium]